MRTDTQREYVSALGSELQLRRDFLDGCGSIKTIYIGGGTPSQLSAADIERLFSYIYNVCDQQLVAETTFEANPDDMTMQLADTLRRCGVNRVSMGTQTFDDSRLRFLHRRHTAEEADRAVQTLRDSGIDNISIDLIYGFPGQTTAQWQQDIDHAIALGVSHLSAYSLMYEEGTPLYAMLRQGKVSEIDEETSAQMYCMLTASMHRAGYEHYEVSNFARPGRRAMHNSSYWDDTPYLGIGAAAHSYNRRRRQWNVADVNSYIASISRGDIPAEGEDIDPDTHYNDLITTALRTSDGLALSMLDDTHRSFLMHCAKRHLDTGQLEMHGDRLRIAPGSVFVGDMIMSDLMKV